MRVSAGAPTMSFHFFMVWAMQFPFFFAFALCVARMQIPPTELRAIDLVVGSAGVVAFTSEWHFGEMARSLMDLSGPAPHIGVR
jgi:hypothetical protein